MNEPTKPTTTDWESFKREAAQDAPIEHTTTDGACDLNDAATVDSYWQQANITNHNKEQFNETFPKPQP